MMVPTENDMNAMNKLIKMKTKPLTVSSFGTSL